MKHYINPDQLKEVAEIIKNKLENLGGNNVDLSKFETLIKDEITFDELNAGAYHKNVIDTPGIRAVKNGTHICGYSICIAFSSYFVELYIGLTNSSPGSVESLLKPTAASYSKTPGISLAVRYYVVSNLFLDKNVVTKNGLTPWHLMTLADYIGFKLGGTCEGIKPWFGTSEQYDALPSIENGMLYCITD